MKTLPKVYEIIDLQSAREFLRGSSSKEAVIITNPTGSTRYYGMRVLGYMFKKLQKEFPQIIKIIVNVDDDHAALFTAVKLGYQNIDYSGDLEEARRILKGLNNKFS